MRTSSLILALLALLWTLPARAENLVVAAGSGYKAYVMDIAAAYQRQTGNEMDVIFGNMAQVIAQTKAGGKADMALGAQWFFQQAGLNLASCLPVGEGKLVLAWAKSRVRNGVDDLTSDAVTRIVMPDPERSIYGRAAAQYLESSGLAARLRNKLVVVGTIAQVGAYLMSGEADFGFMNLTHARTIEAKIGGSVELAEGYAAIRIVMCPTRALTPDTAAGFLRFMETDAVRAIAVKHGL